MRLEQPLYQIDGALVRTSFVLAWAWLGDFASADRQRVAAQVRALARWEEADHEPETDDVQRIVDRWRRERGLSTAASVRAALGEAGMSAEDLEAWATGELAAASEADAIAPHAATEDLLDAFRRHVFFAARLDDYARATALRSVVDEVAADGARMADLRAEVLARVGAASPDVALADLGSFGVSHTEARLVLDREVAWLAWEREMLSPEALAASLSGARDKMEIFRVHTWSGWSLDAAKEAVACLCHDEESMETLAARAGVPAGEQSWLRSQLDALPFGARLLGGRVGDVIGPDAEDGAFVVRQLVRREAPELVDGVVHDDLRRRRLDEALGNRLRDRVSWEVSAT